MKTAYPIIDQSAGNARIPGEKKRRVRVFPRGQGRGEATEERTKAAGTESGAREEPILRYGAA